MSNDSSTIGVAQAKDTNKLLAQFRKMIEIRAFENTAIDALDKKLVLGAIHPSIGQEAVAVGVVAALRKDDILLSTHRGHGHTLVKGAPPLAMMRELFGRQGGSCEGKGGSMHIADFSVGMLGANGVVGANIVIATGAAHAIKLKNLNSAHSSTSATTDTPVVCCIFGDGAVNRGPFLEGLNWSSVFNLPILFVCEDNRYAATTRADAMTAGPGPVQRATSLGVSASQIDGNDVEALNSTTEQLLADIRDGSGPKLLHAITYRQTGHTATDAATYRASAEVEAQQVYDPIDRVATRLVELGFAQSQLDEIQTQALNVMAAVANEAQQTAWPDDNQAFSDVQDVGAPQHV